MSRRRRTALEGALTRTLAQVAARGGPLALGAAAACGTVVFASVATVRVGVAGLAQRRSLLLATEAKR